MSFSSISSVTALVISPLKLPIITSAGLSSSMAACMAATYKTEREGEEEKKRKKGEKEKKGEEKEVQNHK